jgi:hypothetical protein
MVDFVSLVAGLEANLSSDRAVSTDQCVIAEGARF